MSSPLELPQEIVWKLMAVSPDMMDTNFCNKKFPFDWRSSIAISASEPRLSELPENLCGQRLTFLKITCSITGYQPSRKETATGHASFPDVPTEELSRIIDQYFACYGALLNVAVFPFPDPGPFPARTSIDFPQPPGTLLPNPHEEAGVSFEAVGQPNNRITDIFPAGGDDSGELDLFQELVVRLPSSSRVEAFVVHNSAIGVTMEAFAGATLVGSQTAGPEQGQVHELLIEGAGITRVVLKAPENSAALLEFAFVHNQLRRVPLQDYPHIIDFEPKARELVQAASETGEILTTSKSNVKTTKGFTNTESTENSFSLGAEVPIGDKGKLTGALSHKSTESEQENWSVNTEASRERQEKQGTTAQISQLYNILTSYHLGTNRAVFLMLPRPHLLQPTDHRTFVDGLRVIEGVQEFMLIVARPKDMAGLSIEAFLETGHFPEGLTPDDPKQTFDEAIESFTVVKSASSGGLFSGASTESLETVYDILRSDFVIDPTRGDTNHPGVSEAADNSDDQAREELSNYNYRAISDTSVKVEGTITGSRFTDDADFSRTYNVFVRSIKPKTTDDQSTVPIDKLLITSRGLCVSIRSGEICPEVVTPLGLKFDPDNSVVAELTINVNPPPSRRRLTTGTASADVQDLLRKIQTAMTTSWRLPKRRPLGTVGFLDSDYFKDEIKKVLPKHRLEKTLTKASTNDLPTSVVQSLGEDFTVAEVLEMDLTTFARKTGASIADAAAARRKLLGIVPVSDEL